MTELPRFTREDSVRLIMSICSRGWVLTLFLKLARLYAPAIAFERLSVTLDRIPQADEETTIEITTSRPRSRLFPLDDDERVQTPVREVERGANASVILSSAEDFANKHTAHRTRLWRQPQFLRPSQACSAGSVFASSISRSPT